MASLKGPGKAGEYDGSSLRIGIIHSRWNTVIVDALVSGACRSLSRAGVKDENVLIQSVPGSWELPFATQSMFASFGNQSGTSAVSNIAKGLAPATKSSKASSLDAVIAIGVLIKGETMHFEYISDAVSHGLMRVQLDCQLPLVFGVLTLLDEQQGMARAGMSATGESNGHNHGEDWGHAAVELGLKRKAWVEGRLCD